MPQKKLNFTHILWRWFLVLAILLPSFTPLGTTDVQADGIPFLGLIPALIKRNKVYREANSFIKDRAEYYDALRATAAQQLLDRKIGGLRDSQVAAYSKVVALIEGERQSMYDFAESEKKGARDEFIDTFQDEIKNVMLSTTPATRVLGAMSEGINSSQGFIEGVLTKVTGGAGGVFEDLAKIRRFGDRMAIVGGLIGGNVGQSIQKAGSKISDMASPTDSFEADLIRIQGELGALGNLVSGLQEQGYQPTASETTKEVVIHLVTGESANPAVEAIADMLVAKHGQGNIRARARDIMLGNASARCRAHVEQIRQVLYKMEIDPAGEVEDEPGMFPSCSTIDMTALVEEAADAPQPTTEEIQEATEAAPTPTESEPEYVWVLVSTTPNPFEARTNFVGGVGDPEYFGEDRFAGKSLDFVATDGFFSIHAVDVDHEYTYSDTTVSINFDSPPARLESGQEITLTANASHSGTVNEGGGGLGLTFQYSYYDRALDPIYSYLPYNPTWEGSASQSWTFTAPLASEGGEFELWAGLWNSPPCSVVWTYQAQLE